MLRQRRTPRRISSIVGGEGLKNGQNGKKKIVHLDIPIAMLNYQEDWIEVNKGAPGPEISIFSIFKPQKSP